MKNILRNRLALSTVVTTLIILVVSVLLAGVVTYFAINVTSTRVQEESVSLSWQHVWVNNDGTSVAAIEITNTGGRDVVITKITIRGQDTSGLTVATVAAADTTTDLTVANAPKTAGADACPQTLGSGDTISVYISSPGTISLNDIGTTVGFAVFTAQAMYYKEANVQASGA
jgi:hypothetical protein